MVCSHNPSDIKTKLRAPVGSPPTALRKTVAIKSRPGMVFRIFLTTTGSLEVISTVWETDKYRTDIHIWQKNDYFCRQNSKLWDFFSLPKIKSEGTLEKLSATPSLAISMPRCTGGLRQRIVRRNGKSSDSKNVMTTPTMTCRGRPTLT